MVSKISRVMLNIDYLNLKTSSLSVATVVTAGKLE